MSFKEAIFQLHQKRPEIKIGSKCSLLTLGTVAATPPLILSAVPHWPNRCLFLAFTLWADHGRFNRGCIADWVTMAIIMVWEKFGRTLSIPHRFQNSSSNQSKTAKTALNMNCAFTM